MGDIRSIRLAQLHGKLGDLAYQLTQVQFSQVCGPATWRPSVNVYRCKGGFVMCVDLAGVDKADIDLQVEPRRLRLRGHRQPPEPAAADQQLLQVLAMEIDYGAFEREWSFPFDVDVEAVAAEQKNGFLWIQLPLRPEA